MCIHVYRFLVCIFLYIHIRYQHYAYMYICNMPIWLHETDCVKVSPSSLCTWKFTQNDTLQGTQPAFSLKPFQDLRIIIFWPAYLGEKSVQNIWLAHRFCSYGVANNYQLHRGKPTCPLRRGHFKRKVAFPIIIFQETCCSSSESRFFCFHQFPTIQHVAWIVLKTDPNCSTGWHLETKVRGSSEGGRFWLGMELARPFQGLISIVPHQSRRPRETVRKQSSSFWCRKINSWKFGTQNWKVTGFSVVFVGYFCWLVSFLYVFF